ncbi:MULTISPECIES: hypothetical protein [Methylobacterium]|uniref:Uncharacterized protein n=4 Tax=Pseudomonadota TaxID=1224 RepID=A0ABQ4SUC8_9HYPH|nr:MULTISPECIES: hypothetical protein [Methylobacterium]PIU06493.1 MAG: hypothetical protein COT56_09270 [Methylobacterium sp. CG09_land_8_20_14_0_10_71_15]PIU16423.1 MAG: hypothetical protein COT28_00300 [Methylobacterium sp. CG08_land_8_20_14_0_20_71_15]GBU16449.1 hypothetical protein AwMethylo_06640 [Methylobacterium sp.]GJE06058.1 hypothetical protein AOPFMNJM_1364 [Methylobacterium jeotgali]
MRLPMRLDARSIALRAGVAALLGGCLVVLPSVGVRAQGAGLGGLFDQLFGAPPRQVEAPPSAAPAFQEQYRRRLRSASRPRHRYAALNVSEPLSLRIGDRQKPLDMKNGAAAALLRDETLRPGDIVILKTGARVYTGSAGGKRTMRDFEAADSSSMVSRKTRALLAAMVAPRGALPAAEARRVAGRVNRIVPKQAAPAKAEPAVVQQAAAPMRVINPWIAKPAR